MTYNIPIYDAHNITVSLLVDIQTIKHQKITIFGYDTETNPVVTREPFFPTSRRGDGSYPPSMFCCAKTHRELVLVILRLQKTCLCLRLDRTFQGFRNFCCLWVLDYNIPLVCYVRLGIYPIPCTLLKAFQWVSLFFRAVLGFQLSPLFYHFSCNCLDLSMACPCSFC